MVLLLLSVGVFSGVTAGLLGVGGGLVFLPFAKIYYIDICGYSPQVYRTMVATSSVIIASNSLNAVVHHYRHDNLIPSLFPWFMVASLVGAFVGTRLMNTVPVALLEGGLVAFLLWGAWKILRSKESRSPQTPLTRVQVIQLSGGGTIISVFSSMIGVGGGGFMVPLLKIVGKLPTRVVVGTSSLFTLAVSLTAAGYYLAGPTVASPVGGTWTMGQVDLTVALFVSLGGIVGSWVGSRLLYVFSVDYLKKAFAGLLILSAVKMVY